VDGARPFGTRADAGANTSQQAKKNSVQARFGHVAIANPFSALVLDARISPYLQAKLVLLAAEHVFAHVPPLVESLLGICVSTTQVYRRTQAATLRAGQPAALLCVVRSEGSSPLAARAPEWP